jgi:hypothetical protein
MSPTDVSRSRRGEPSVDCAASTVPCAAVTLMTNAAGHRRRQRSKARRVSPLFEGDTSLC